jgi:hypothetical protein
MVIEQPRGVYERMKGRVVVGVRGLRAAQGETESEDDD